MRSISYLVDIHPETGEYISGWERIRVSILRILQTRLRTRLMREWFGCDFLNIQDKPLTQEVWMDSIIAMVEAVNTFEPEFNIESATITRATSKGDINISIYGKDLVEETNRNIRDTISPR